MIGIVLESMQKEHEAFNREPGEGKAGWRLLFSASCCTALKIPTCVEWV